MNNTMEKTILIVDDFKNTRFVIKFTLQNAGYKILEAEDGRGALKFLDGRKLDLVITDYNMPEMNGIEFIEEMKKNPLYQYTPVILLTTETREDVKKQAYEVGITGWIHKPFKFDQFLAIVKKALR